MDRVTVSLDEDSGEVVSENVGDGEAYESKSAFVRECIREYEQLTSLQNRVDELENELATVQEERDSAEAEADELRERVDDLETELEQQEARADDLRRQLKAANAKNDRMQELARYVEDERRVEQQWREAGLLTKTKWRLFGMPTEEETTTAQ
jgi:Arc/MetJ-type ribon-helix-helix transcriptional regulator